MCDIKIRVVFGLLGCSFVAAIDFHSCSFQQSSIERDTAFVEREDSLISDYLVKASYTSCFFSKKMVDEEPINLDLVTK